MRRNRSILDYIVVFGFVRWFLEINVEFERCLKNVLERANRINKVGREKNCENDVK